MLSRKYPGRGISRWQHPIEKYTLVENKSPFINVWKMRSTAQVIGHFHFLKLPDALLEIYLPFSHTHLGLSETPALWKPRLHGAGPGVLLLGKWAVISNSNSTEGIETLAQISSLLFLLCEEHFDPCRGSGKYVPIIYKALYTKITCPHTSKRLLMAQVLVQRALYSSVISQPGFSSFPNPTLAFGSVVRFLS